jgi:hypothetical protein
MESQDAEHSKDGIFNIFGIYHTAILALGWQHIPNILNIIFEE